MLFKGMVKSTSNYDLLCCKEIVNRISFNSNVEWVYSSVFNSS